MNICTGYTIKADKPEYQIKREDKEENTRNGGSHRNGRAAVCRYNKETRVVPASTASDNGPGAYV